MNNPTHRWGSRPSEWFQNWARGAIRGKQEIQRVEGLLYKPAHGHDHFEALRSTCNKTSGPSAICVSPLQHLKKSGNDHYLKEQYKEAIDQYSLALIGDRLVLPSLCECMCLGCEFGKRARISEAPLMPRT